MRESLLNKLFFLVLMENELFYMDRLEHLDCEVRLTNQGYQSHFLNLTRSRDAR